MESGIIFLITISWISSIIVIKIGLCPFLRRGIKLMDLEGREIRNKWEEQRERKIQLEYIEWAKNPFLIKGKKQEKTLTVKNGIIIIFSGRIFKCVFMTSYLDFMNKYFIERVLKITFESVSHLSWSPTVVLLREDIVYGQTLEPSFWPLFSLTNLIA